MRRKASMPKATATALFLCLFSCAHHRPAKVPEKNVQCRGHVPPVTPAPAAASAVPELPQVVSRLDMAAVGDVIPHGEVLKAAAMADCRDPKGASTNNEGFDALFEQVGEELKGHDFVFANLETPIAPAKGEKTRPFFFNAPVALVRSLCNAGINVVSIANNHIYDQKRPGLVETLEHLKGSCLTFAGGGSTCAEAQSARLLEAKGFKVAFLASSMLYNKRLNAGTDEPCAAEFDLDGVLQSVRKARAEGAEIVVMSLHWGKEYSTEPQPEQVEIAHRLCDGGVDVLLGHHPHVLEPIEVRLSADGRHCIIAYSLGNFISNQSRFYTHRLHPSRMGNTRDGVIVHFSAEKVRYGDGKTRVELVDLWAEPTWTVNNALEFASGRASARRIYPVVARKRLEQVMRLLACKDPKSPDWVSLSKERRLLRDRIKAAAAIIGEDLVPPLPEMPAPGEVACENTGQGEQRQGRKTPTPETAACVGPE